MRATRPNFLDTNILLYLLDEGTRKADRAESLITGRAVVSVQVLSEFTSVARRKLAFELNEIDEVVGAIRDVCSVEPLSVGTYESARRLAERYRLPWYDAMIAASALTAGCTRLYSEDFQHGQVIDRRLHLVNPFRVAVHASGSLCGFRPTS